MQRAWGIYPNLNILILGLVNFERGNFAFAEVHFSLGIVFEDIFEELVLVFFGVFVVFAVFLDEFLDVFFVEAEVGVFPSPFVVQMDHCLKGLLVDVQEFVLLVPELLVGLEFQLTEAKFLDIVKSHRNAFF